MDKNLFLKHQAQISKNPKGFKIKKAEGIYIEDISGKKYLDLVAGVSANTLGHNHPNITYAIKKQLSKYALVPPRPHMPPVFPQWAELLLPMPQNVLGHNLHHMAALAIPTATFCMVFQLTTSLFWEWGNTFGTWDPHLGPKPQLGIRTRSGQCFEQ